MIDPCQERLLHCYQNNDHTANPSAVLWVLDENSEPLTTQLKQTPCLFLTNRWDVHTQFKDNTCRFSDYQFENYSNLDTIYFRLPKEKAVVHHIINQSYCTLKEGGKLIFSGEKNDGIKTYEKKAKILFGESSLEKHKNTYLVVLTKTSHSKPDQLLDDQEYSNPREIKGIDGLHCYSKPGIFGWNKIDQGSELLLHQFTENDYSHQKNAKILDLGCGWGYLALSLSQMGFKNIDASDNNAGAVEVLKKSVLKNNLSMTVWADNCASSKSKEYDIILCNPPFHKGFDHSYSLTDTFLNALKRLLKPNGVGFIVVNQFIPVEKFANSHFNGINILTKDNGFKVFCLSNNLSN